MSLQSEPARFMKNWALMVQYLASILDLDFLAQRESIQAQKYNSDLLVTP